MNVQEMGACQMDENELIEDAIRNPDAFKKIIHLYYEEVLKYIYIRTGDMDISEDLAQETFIKVFKNLASFKKRCPLIFWILRIATNVVISHFRAKSHLEKYLSQIKTSTYEEGINNSQLTVYEILHKHIMNLRSDYQTVIILKFFNKTSTAEISYILNKTPAATRKILQRAVDSLRKEVEKSVIFFDFVSLIYEKRNFFKNSCLNLLTRERV